MFSLAVYFEGLLAATVVAFCVWLVSVLKADVSIVDSLWPLLFVLLGLFDASGAKASGAGALGAGAGLTSTAKLLLALLILWGLRLSVYITWRNWGHGEDRRYQAIRTRNQPFFAVKSLYLVFLLQAVLAWIISLPLHAAILSGGTLGITGCLGALLWFIGFFFEAGADWQLARFKSIPANRDKVMDRGLWRLTRHPNYFGDFCVWWGFYLIAAGAGAWWSIVGPILMSVLLMRVSGVTLLEEDIGERRPQYAGYVRRTNAFFPGWPKGR